MKHRGDLNEKEGRYLLKVARETIESKFYPEKKADRPASDLPPVFHEHRGTFVTLTIKGRLRGCIGHIIAQESLLEGIRINALNAAFRDPRFPPLSEKEWKSVKIEISILTDPEPLSYTDGHDLLSKIRPGMDGLIIKKGYHQATFLPQVWDQLPGKEDFLGHLCMKAGLPREDWKGGELEVKTYRVQAFEEE